MLKIDHQVVDPSSIINFELNCNRISLLIIVCVRKKKQDYVKRRMMEKWIKSIQNDKFTQ